MFRHTFAHFSKDVLDDDELMRLAGWKSRQMLGRYAASTAEERAREAGKRSASSTSRTSGPDSPVATAILALAGLSYATVLAHRSLTARLRLDLATIACSAQMLRDCLAQADTALALAPGGPVAGQLNLIRARAAARLGDTRAARHAIAQANQAIDRGPAADTVDIISQIRFSPAAPHSSTGAALLEIPAPSRMLWPSWNARCSCIGQQLSPAPTTIMTT